jgi:hypothetical protein
MIQASLAFSLDGMDAAGEGERRWGAGEWRGGGGGTERRRREDSSGHGARRHGHGKVSILPVPTAVAGTPFLFVEVLFGPVDVCLEKK